MTPEQPPDSTIVRFQRRFRKNVLWAAAFLVAAALLFVTRHPVLAAGAAAIGAMFLLAAFVASGECSCPQCGYRITGIGQTLSCCPSCGEYWLANNRRLVRPDDGFVGGSSTVNRFAIKLPWDDLLTSRRKPIPYGRTGARIEANRGLGCPRVLEASWPAMCSVCGRPVAKEEAVKMTVVKGQEGPGAPSLREQEIDLIAFVPHCGEHKEGVSIGFSTRTKVVDGVEHTLTYPALFFASYRYYRAFKGLNPWN